MVYLYVGIAAIVGALLRYWVGLAVGTRWHHDFPLATLFINLIGSFALAWLTTAVFNRGLIHKLLVPAVGTGLVGSFTTFSTFSVETVHLIQGPGWGPAIGYVMLSLWGGLGMSYLGFQLGRGLGQKEGGGAK